MVKKEDFRNELNVECKMEEFMFSQKWQEKEDELKSKMHALETNADGVTIQSSGIKPSLAKAEFRQMAHTSIKMLTDSIVMKLRELE